MKRVRVFIVYFPVLLVSLQVAANLLYFIAPELYLSAGFYLNTFLGTNVLFALFLAAMTFSLRFCALSRYAAIAEVLFAANYLVVQQDSAYNIMFQIVVGCLALILTVRYYANKFPLCNFSLVIRFFKNVFRERSCKKGLERFDREIEYIIKHQPGRYERRQYH